MTLAPKQLPLRPAKGCALCGERIHALGLCSKHYRQESRYGAEVVLRRLREQVGEQK